MKLRFLTAITAMAALALSVSAAGKTITVKNAHDFIKALGPDRTIVIAANKPLNITDELEKMINSGEIQQGPTYYGMDQVGTVQSTLTYCSQFDGNGLQLRSCDNLTIKGKGKNATLLASPRYVNVMEFIHCDNIKLENLTMGHTEGGYCDKGVVEFDGCQGVTIDDSDFFGCGTEGFVFEDCRNVTVNRSCVHDCTYHTMHIKDCTQVRFNDCIFRDNREFSQINVSDTERLFFTGCVFDNLQGPFFNSDSHHYFFSCTFRNCQLTAPEKEWAPVDKAIVAYGKNAGGNMPLIAGAPKPAIKPGLYTDGGSIYRVTQADPYRYAFISTEENGDAFAVDCVSATENKYMTAPYLPYENKHGHYDTEVKTIDGKTLVCIYNDAHEIIKSFVFLKKK